MLKFENNLTKSNDANMDLFLQNMIKGHQLYLSILNDPELLDTIKVSEINENMMSLMSFYSYKNMYKRIVLEWEEINKYNLLVAENGNKSITSNENDYLRICNNCMALTKLFDEQYFQMLIWTLITKKFNDHQRAKKSINIYHNIVQEQVKKLNGIPLLNIYM